MGLYTQAIPSLHNGVSQQSPAVRSTDQLEEQINGWSSIADGTGKRPGSEVVSKLATTAPANAHIHAIDRDGDEQYIAIANGGTIRVFDFDTGTEQEVLAPGGWGYLSGVTDWSADVAMFTVADYTFVVNKKRAAAMAALGQDSITPAAYQLWLNRVHGVNEEGQSYAPGAAYQYEPNPNIGPLTGTVQSFQKLPEGAANGAVYKITGSDETNFTSYYVRRNAGVWDECVAPGLVNAIDPATMPHALVRQYDGRWTFAPYSWAPRRVGDYDTNPNPGFIGRTISSVFFYQNRLALLYDENVTLSVAGDFGNFWRMTTLDAIDSDVIDVAATTTRVSLLQHAVPFNDGIVLFADRTQFAMSNGEAGLSASSIAIKPVTNYEVSRRAAPVPLGTEVYFPSEKNGWATIREYTRLADSDATSAADVTAHVPRYIPAGVHQLVGASDLNALFVLTDGAPSCVYVYQFYWVDAQTKAQSAWHHWDFGLNVRVMAGAYLKGYLYVLLSRPDGLWLERINLQAGAVSPGASLPIHYDRLVAVTGVYNPATQKTQFQLPYTDTPESPLRVVRGAAFGPLAMSLIDPIDYQFLAGNVLVINGNHAAGQVFVGAQYTFKLVFSKQYIRRGDGTAVTTGRLQLRTFTVTYNATGFFRTEVQPYGKAMDPEVEEIIPAKLADFTGKTLGSADLRLGTPQRASGDYSFQVYGEAEQAIIAITNRTHVSSTFVSAEWEAFYFNRART